MTGDLDRLSASASTPSPRSYERLTYAEGRRGSAMSAGDHRAARPAEHALGTWCSKGGL